MYFPTTTIHTLLLLFFHIEQESNHSDHKPFSLLSCHFVVILHACISTNELCHSSCEMLCKIKAFSYFYPRKCSYRECDISCSPNLLFCLIIIHLSSINSGKSHFSSLFNPDFISQSHPTNIICNQKNEFKLTFDLEVS